MKKLLLLIGFVSLTIHKQLTSYVSTENLTDLEDLVQSIKEEQVIFLKDFLNIKKYKMNKSINSIFLLMFFTTFVNAQSLTSIIGPTEVCNGSQNVQYVFNGTGVPNATYEWNSPFYSGTTNSSSIIININTPNSSASIGCNEIVNGLVIAYGTLQINIKQTPDLGVITGTTAVGCPSSTNYKNYSVNLNSSVSDYIWTVPSGATFTGILNQPNKINVNYGSTSVSGIITVKAGCGTTFGNLSTLPITVNPWPSAAQAFSGPSSICVGQTGQTGLIYNVPIIANATSYQWTLPSGATCTSGCTTNIIHVNYGAAAVSGNITVQGVNSCGAGSAFSIPITVNRTNPTGTGIISGNSSVCWGNTINYIVSSIVDAASYQWTLPNGATGTSTTNSINVYYNILNYPQSGNITVTPVNSCGAGATASLYVNTNAFSPGLPGIISGATQVCAGQNNVIYSIPSINYASSYEWTLPSGATGTSITNNIAVSYGSASLSGNITVRGKNVCGVGQNALLPIYVGFPSNAGAISGNTTVCKGQNGVTYSVPSIANATAYVWTLPNGVTGSSTTNSITVNYGTTAVTGNITVKGTNNCGNGVASTLAVVVNNTLPPTGNTSQNFTQGQTLSNLQVTGTNLTWYANQSDANNQVSPITNSTLLVNGSTYYVTQTNNGCESVPLGITVTTALSLNDYSKGEIKLYPNPTTLSILHLSIKDGICIDKISIGDITGKIVLELTENLSSINVEKLAKGVYILTAYEGEKKYQEKFIKE
ncbi:MAG: T9SS type A sorting domain-containing protein [Flavobacterium sp.]